MQEVAVKFDRVDPIEARVEAVGEAERYLKDGAETRDAPLIVMSAALREWQHREACAATPSRPTSHDERRDA
jgi:hypothetical protein